MLRKGQARWVGHGVVRRQNLFVDQRFELAPETQHPVARRPLTHRFQSCNTSDPRPPTRAQSSQAGTRRSYSLRRRLQPSRMARLCACRASDQNVEVHVPAGSDAQQAYRGRAGDDRSG